MSVTLYVGNDNLIEVTELKNEAEDTYINNATVTVTLIDPALSPQQVSGESWPLSLAYVSGSNGNYRATLVDTLSLSRSTKYIAQVSADGGTGLKGYWEVEAVAIIREN